MKVALALLCVVAVVAVATAAPFSEDQYQFLFTKWVSHHGKAYAHDQFFSKYNVWKSNLNRIMAHNEGNATWTMGMNQFGDMTGEEFKARYTGYVPRDYDHLRAMNSKRSLQHIQAADSLDWRTKGAVTAVKNQQQCGSCWAFSATGSIEGAWAISSGKLVSVSEQQLVDCSGPQGNQGCNGGLMDQAFEYVIKKGLCAEGDYPYTAKDGQCKDSKCTPAVHISGFEDIPQGDENSMMKAVNIGPVSIAIEADQTVFQFYSGGVLDSDQCGTNLDHGVLIVGYGTDSGKDYWIVKNSWGASWGQSGYILLARGKNECGLALAASYPKV